MNDLISRQEAPIKRFESALLEHKDGSFILCTPKFVSMAVEILKALKAWQWIPCSERLPSTKDDYIITVKDKSLKWTDYIEWSADYHWWEYDDDMVIAWMPSPEPYKGEES